MKFKVLFAAGAGVALLALAACGGDHASPPPAAQGGNQSLDSGQVLALAQRTSETSAPLVVNDGAITLNDTSETSSPIPVNAM